MSFGFKGSANLKAKSFLVAIAQQVYHRETSSPCRQQSAIILWPKPNPKPFMRFAVFRFLCFEGDLESRALCSESPLSSIGAGT